MPAGQPARHHGQLIVFMSTVSIGRSFISTFGIWHARIMEGEGERYSSLGRETIVPVKIRYLAQLCCVARDWDSFEVVLARCRSATEVCCETNCIRSCTIACAFFCQMAVGDEIRTERLAMVAPTKTRGKQQSATRNVFRLIPRDPDCF